MSTNNTEGLCVQVAKGLKSLILSAVLSFHDNGVNPFWEAMGYEPGPTARQLPLHPSLPAAEATLKSAVVDLQQVPNVEGTNVKVGGRLSCQNH